jgi:hypothetical protein
MKRKGCGRPKVRRFSRHLSSGTEENQKRTCLDSQSSRLRSRSPAFSFYLVFMSLIMTINFDICSVSIFKKELQQATILYCTVGWIFTLQFYTCESWKLLRGIEGRDGYTTTKLDLNHAARRESSTYALVLNRVYTVNSLMFLFHN